MAMKLTEDLKQYVNTIAGHCVSDHDAIEFLEGLEEYYETVQGNLQPTCNRRKISESAQGKAEEVRLFHGS